MTSPGHPPPAREPADGLVEHPDGWYWTAPDGRQAFGPFETPAQAIADRDRASDDAVDPAEAEREAEQDLGVADAIAERRREEALEDEDDGSRADSDVGP